MQQNDNDNDYVRPPDAPITECLVGSDYNYNNSNNIYIHNEYIYKYEYENIDQVLKQSLADFELEEEQKLNKLLETEKKELIEKYASIKKKLQKIQGHDTTNKDMYETIIAIIEMYEMEYFNKYMLDETSYHNIFKLINSIRLTKEESMLLNTLIILQK
jgi:hypothetical protein